MVVTNQWGANAKPGAHPIGNGIESFAGFVAVVGGDSAITKIVIAGPTVTNADEFFFQIRGSSLQLDALPLSV